MQCHRNFFKKYSRKFHRTASTSFTLLAIAGSGLSYSSLAFTSIELFDDFSYSNTSELTNNGWVIRTWEGSPGISNGEWSDSNISFVKEGDLSVMRLKASTDVNGDNISANTAMSGASSQAEVSRAENIYQNGTWATRIYFNDAPVTGPDSDTVIETFFGLTPYIEGTEPYSEIDFEYLPNGGWYSGSAEPAMWSGTYRLVDWSNPDNHAATRTVGSLQGWHTLVMQVTENAIDFYIDGTFQTGFTGEVAPDYPMYLMFQIWFSNDCFDASCSRGGYISSNDYREYYEDVDWVYFQQDNILSTTEVEQKVLLLRSEGVTYKQAITDDSSDDADETDNAVEICNWWGTTYALCKNLNSGWGWEDDDDCVGRYTCETLDAPYGVIDVTSADNKWSLTIQAEDYSAAADVTTESTTDAGGGQNIGYIDQSDWMSYADITFLTSGDYTVEYRVASEDGSQLSLDLNAGTIQLGTLNIPATGGWQNWTTISHSVYIAAGTYNVGLYASEGGWNINWIKFSQ
jgi:hypothetical protein